VRSPRRSLLVILSLLALGAAACTDTEIRVEDYSQECEVNSDCVFVYFGDACAGCMTDLQPINASELASHRADIDEAASTCAPWSERFHVECTVPVPSEAPSCVDGTCSASASSGACSFEDGGVCRGIDP
jgi:hypothetical protein